MNLQEDTKIFFEDGSKLTEQFEVYEKRDSQIEMAVSVAQSIEEESHLIVEAPTGVGKSFAYLVPAALYAVQNKSLILESEEEFEETDFDEDEDEESEQRKVVISTGTITLQEQLVQKDLPSVQKLIPELSFLLVKGRQNYLCQRRLHQMANTKDAVFESREDSVLFGEILDFSKNAVDGDKTELGYEPSIKVWKMICSDRNSCLKRKCPNIGSCFFYRAREKMRHADILVVNHHLYFADLALRDGDSAILPSHQITIFDEAHTLEDIATDHLGIQVSDGQVRFLLDELFSKKEKGILANDCFSAHRDKIENIRKVNEAFWTGVADRLTFTKKNDETFRLTEPNFIENTLSPALDSLGKILNSCVALATDDDLVMEIKSRSARAYEMAGGLIQVIEMQMESFVYYATIPNRGRKGSMSLSAHPLSVGKILKELLFDELRTAVITSATLAADSSERFLFLRKRLGIEGGMAKRLDSPFDFSKQAKLMINESAIDPNSSEYETALSMWLGDLLERVDGGTFILFTSYRQLDNVYELLAPRLERRGRTVLRQGGGINRGNMLSIFKEAGEAVLFGTASFWEGVDVQGNALQNVVIVKLPFEMPTHPLVEARHEEITKKGGNPFMERTVPEAILRLKQGVGRLIRTKTDTGLIVLCDHRILTKAYGRYFVKALPEMPIEKFRLN